MSFLNFVQGLVKTRWKSLKGFDQSHHVLLLCRKIVIFNFVNLTWTIRQQCSLPAEAPIVGVTHILNSNTIFRIEPKRIYVAGSRK